MPATACLSLLPEFELAHMPAQQLRLGSDGGMQRAAGGQQEGQEDEDEEAPPVSSFVGNAVVGT